MWVNPLTIKSTTKATFHFTNGDRVSWVNNYYPIWDTADFVVEEIMKQTSHESRLQPYLAWCEKTCPSSKDDARRHVDEIRKWIAKYEEAGWQIYIGETVEIPKKMFI